MLKRVKCFGARWKAWNCAGVASEEEGVAVVGDDVDVDGFADDFHAPQEFGGDGADDDAVVVVVECLHFCEVLAYGLVFLAVDVGEEDGFLDACASLALKVFYDVVSNFVAFDVVHDEE